MKDLKKQIYQQLTKVIDPELKIDIVSMGLIYDVSIGQIQLENDKTRYKIHILMTLTTPGCPLIGVLQQMIRAEVSQIEQIESQDIDLELTFDPPWVPDMMSEEARAELGLA